MINRDLTVAVDVELLSIILYWQDIAVGPVAILSLMTATVAAIIAEPGTQAYIGVAMVLAILSGTIQILMGILRMGFLANLLSHPVASGFITASGILIAISQLKHLPGLNTQGNSVFGVISSLFVAVNHINYPTIVIGISSLISLIWFRKLIKPLLMAFGLTEQAAIMIARMGPVLVIVISTMVVMTFNLEASGVKILGDMIRQHTF